jgi:hypothetical protein
LRTTISLDPDTRALIERAMREHGLSFKEAVNGAIRAGLAPAGPGPRRYTKPRRLGPPRVDVIKALRVAGELEDEALGRQLSEGR